MNKLYCWVDEECSCFREKQIQDAKNLIKNLVFPREYSGRVKKTIEQLKEDRRLTEKELTRSAYDLNNFRTYYSKRR